MLELEGVTVGGNSPSLMTNDTGTINAFMCGINSGTGSTSNFFYVNDTGSAPTPDLTVAASLGGLGGSGSGYTGGFIKLGAGSMALSGQNSFQGGIKIVAGSVIVTNGGTLGNGNTGSSFPGVITNSGTFAYGGTNWQVMTGTISNFGNIINTSPAVLEIDGTLMDSGSLYQNGPGTLLLSGAFTSNGNTYVNAGRLVASSSQTYGGAVTVGDSGILRVLGVASGSSGFSPATLNLGSVNGATVEVSLRGTAHAPLTPTNLNLIGAPQFLVLPQGMSSLSAGTSYPVLTYGTLSGGVLTAANFVLPVGVTGSFTQNGNTWSLNVASVASPAELWQGFVNGNWDIGQTPNWLLGGNQAAYADGSAVTFDDTGLITSPVTGSTLLSPSLVTFNNSISPTGKNVIIGVIDQGVYWRHQDFQNPDGTTRFRYIWDQGAGGGNTPPGYGYGNEYNWVDINNGNCQEIDPANDYGHGTIVTGIAAGNSLSLQGTSRAGTLRGAAPESQIIFVKLDNSTNANFLSNVSDAISYIYQKAAALCMPAVINTSVGTYYGSHDGTDMTAELIDSLITLRNDSFSCENLGRVLVAAAGNGGNIRYHFVVQFISRFQQPGVYVLFVQPIRTGFLLGFLG